MKFKTLMEIGEQMTETSPLPNLESYRSELWVLLGYLISNEGRYDRGRGISRIEAIRELNRIDSIISERNYQGVARLAAEAVTDA